jgi:NAD(P)-dependent dehydrogenase (short-subunit alcohol dehydrogenase family)
MSGMRRVLITGGGSGIGRAAARAFAERGAHVLIVGRTKQTLAETADGFPAIDLLDIDITAPDAPAAIEAAVEERLGGLDVLVNNAGVIRPAPLGGLTDADIEVQLGTNLIAPIRLTQTLLPLLADTRGTVLNVSTAVAAGERGWPGTSLYGASKAALDYLTRTWAVELGRRGIRVLSVAPGVTDTDVVQNGGVPAERAKQAQDAYLADVPLGRIAAPEEVAHWIVELCTPEAAYATGVVFRLDGGMAVG